MDTPSNETVVDKAVAFVKDMFGVSEPARRVEPEYPETTPEATAEDAMRLDPNAYVVNTAGQMTTDSFVAPLEETTTDRLRREVGEQTREKGALELNAESARREDGGG